MQYKYNYKIMIFSFQARNSLFRCMGTKFSTSKLNFLSFIFQFVAKNSYLIFSGNVVYSKMYYSNHNVIRTVMKDLVIFSDR